MAALRINQILHTVTWRIWLFERRTSVRLSHKSVGGKKVTPSSLSNDSSHISSELVNYIQKIIRCFSSNYSVACMGTKQTKSTPEIVIDMEPDRLSSLPDHVIDKILSCLPIKEAVGTSVLSSQWNNQWYTVSRLVFDTDCVSMSHSEDPTLFNSKFLQIVNHVLLLHSGPIIKFEICNYNDSFTIVIPKIEIDRWIHHLIGRSVQKLVLEVWIEKGYQIPCRLFSCQSLRTLKLFWCSVKPPTKFKGFKNLKTLQLEEITISQDAFENLISGCLLLENLILANLDGITQINIHAPNLKFLEILDTFEDISFDETFRLTDVYVSLSSYLNSESNQSRLHGGSSNLLKFFDHRRHIQDLEINNYFLKYLTAGVVPVKLPTLLKRLLSLSICINFDDLKEISAALCLLRSSSNLQTLEISARIEQHSAPLTPINDIYCWEEIFLKPETPIQVRNVKIKNISGFQLELDFIRFLLLNLPVLKKMTVKPIVNVRPELVTGLIRFKRESRDAEVIYNVEDSDDD
ncbi:F-box/FBD/LRR-repeat protein At1g13570-like [Vicia villosa]|uniref:F-box/FBD/LRR-repeat protein At1g13570-like n=1 Tax=Vicia villosa TaxID=3911 RepID=UPI00273CAC0F|nr:F-box/FBD/LRR-repeat protein At1g13570-like [Vicia villosa]